MQVAIGDCIYKAHETASYAFVIRQGIVRTYYTTHHGKEFIKIFQTNGQMVSPYLENMMGIAPRTTSEAVTDVTGVVIPFNTLIEVLDSSPDLIKLHLRIIQMFYGMKERREYELLTMDATQRYKNFIQEYGEIAEQIPNMHVASYLGITPVSLSRLRKQFK
jgi:CRP-like cAMP-binding protein